MSSLWSAADYNASGYRKPSMRIGKIKGVYLFGNKQHYLFYSQDLFVVLHLQVHNRFNRYVLMEAVKGDNGRMRVRCEMDDSVEAVLRRRDNKEADAFLINKDFNLDRDSRLLQPVIDQFHDTSYNVFINDSRRFVNAVVEACGSLQYYYTKYFA